MSDGLVHVRLVPTAPGQGHLIHAHLEAHDHLATATDLPDGSVRVSGPAAQRDEIDRVVREIARAVGCLVG